MIFKACNSESGARVFFNEYFFGCILLGLITLCRFISEGGMLSTLSGFMYIVIISLLCWNKIFGFAAPVFLYLFLTK